MKKPLKIPEYFKDLPDNANLNSRDVAEIFGVKHMARFYEGITNGTIPKNDEAYKCGSVNAFSRERHGTKHVFWKVKTIREWIKNHQNT